MEQKIKLNSEAAKTIGQKISKIEKNTNGEIFAVLAKQSDDYFYVQGFFAALWALAIGMVISFAAWYFWIALPSGLIPLAQVIGFLMLFALCRIFPRLGMNLVLFRVRHMRAHGNAQRQFLAHGIHNTETRTGVLIFVSLAERYCEVVADSGIYQKVDHEVWNEIIDQMIEDIKADDLEQGFLHAIERAGEILSQHFPRVEGQQNELNDYLVII
jgi:putative membrane protein